MKMNNLVSSIQENASKNISLPYSIYSSVYEQKLLNVPIAKPLFVLVLSGRKELGNDREILCRTGQFVFLSDRPSIDMRNVPLDENYRALLIDFEYQDFADIPSNCASKADYFVGDSSSDFIECLNQFIRCSAWAPQEVISSRKKELLMMLYLQGFADVGNMIGKPKVSHALYDLYIDQSFNEITTASICSLLAMSESTLRRKLSSEGTSIQEVKDKAKLSTALSLLQTTDIPINQVAEKCGYQSQSRFTDRFKKHFNITPSELRKTQMKD